MYDPIIMWKVCVERLEEQSFEDTVEDEYEFDGYVDSRREIQEHWDSYDEATKTMVLELDERFKKALFPALRKANLLKEYNEYDPVQPQEEWWWHLKP